ncbi:MAG: YciI family protein, partial [Candidatus Heimdallarchaeaceae archaeon]
NEFCEIVVIRCNDREQAEEIVENDPYTKKNIFPVFLYDFRASLVLNELVEEVDTEKGFDVNSLYKTPTNQYLGTVTPRSTFISDVTEEENKIMEIHFQYLKNRYDKMKLFLAGPILEEGTFGVSVFLAESLDEADQFQKQDPAVMAGIMEPEVHPFRIFFLGTK